MEQIGDLDVGVAIVRIADFRSLAEQRVGFVEQDDAIDALGLSGRFSHVSTGGGATLVYLEGKTLPGIAILKEA